MFTHKRPLLAVKLAILFVLLRNSSAESWFDTTRGFLQSIVSDEELEDIVNMEVPDIMPVGWNDIFQTGSQIGQAFLDNLDISAIQNIVPDLTAYGFDANYIRSHVGSWNWEKFMNDLMDIRPEAWSSHGHSHSYSKQIDDLYDLVHSYASFEASVEDKAELPPECFMTVPEIVRYSGYPCTAYTVVTKDGYKLTMHRIPFGSRKAEESNDRLSTFEVKGRRNAGGENTWWGRQKRPVVFLQHGILSDSSCWVSSGRDRSLAFHLADAGFDVWMGNVRGNTYSRAHVSLDPDKDERYWRFSWQQMSEFDLPAMVDAALSVTRQSSLYYIGHSQGTLIAFARLAEDPSFNAKIKLMLGLAPVATLGHINSPVKWLAGLTDVAHFGVSLFGGTEVLPSTAISKWITAKLHKMSKEDPLAYHGHNLLLFLVGFNVLHYHKDRLPVFMAQTPSGTSLHNFIHMSQLVESGRMQKWSYWSEEENMKEYGQITPPEYDVSKIRTPVALFLGSKDDLADLTDGRLLASKLTNMAYFRIFSDWDHLDFMWGQQAPKLLYPDIVGIIEGMEKEKPQRPKRTNVGYRHIRGVDDEL